VSEWRDTLSPSLVGGKIPQSFSSRPLPHRKAARPRKTHTTQHNSTQLSRSSTLQARRSHLPAGRPEPLGLPHCVQERGRAPPLAPPAEFSLSTSICWSSLPLIVLARVVSVKRRGEDAYRLTATGEGGALGGALSKLESV
jgi:hypothetical protein